MPFNGLVAISVGLLASSGFAFGGSPKSEAVAVTMINADVTSQVLDASQHAASEGHAASFTIFASGAHHRAAVHEPVTFYIGVMAPGSGVPPKTWIPSSSSAAEAYVAHASHYTNMFGQAKIVLKGQPAQTMEMIAVKVGSFSGYNPATNMASAALDAWWTTPQSTPSAVARDTVTVAPFMLKTSKASERIHVVTRHSNRVAAGITVHDFVKSMSAPTTELTQTTDSQGTTSFTVPVDSASGTINVLKFANPATSLPFAGGVMAWGAAKQSS